MLTKPLIPLELLRHGEWGEVTAVEGELPWVSRLAEMGLRPGARVCMLQPGRPCLFQMGGCRLSLRLDDAGQVFVQPVSSPTVECGVA